MCKSVLWCDTPVDLSGLNVAHQLHTITLLKFLAFSNNDTRIPTHFMTQGCRGHVNVRARFGATSDKPGPQKLQPSKTNLGAKVYAPNLYLNGSGNFRVGGPLAPPIWANFQKVGKGQTCKKMENIAN